MKRAPLQPSGYLAGMSRKRRARQREYRKVRRWVADRSNGLCEAQVSGVCTVRGEHAHHVLMRSRGGSDEPGNLLWVCWPCHGHIHANPAWSYARGLLRRNGNGRTP